MSETNPQTSKRTKALIILDGWGNRAEKRDNAIAAADTPNWDRLLGTYPSSSVATSGDAVGLPDGQMGNSEVGHMNLGAGRTVFQNFTRINNAVADGQFVENEALNKLIEGVKARDGVLHVMGLLSDGGVHSHRNHIEAMCRMAAFQGLRKINVHAFLDGRDTPPRCAQDMVKVFEANLADQPAVRLVSLTGRYFAMDRDNRWDRIEKAYRLIVDCEGQQYDSASLAIEAAYNRDEDDEFVQASVVTERGQLPESLSRDDGVVFMNFRPDRARQLSRALIDPDFDQFSRKFVLAAEQLVTLTAYSAELSCPVAFPPKPLVNSLGEVIALSGRSQLRIAETEKYAHVTFFFNGGREAPFPGEERILVPSPDVASYDLQPEMSAPEMTDQLVNAIRSREFDLIVCNYANGDMVGHTGDFNAAIKAVESVDQCLGRIIDAVLESEGECLITADHGNVETMFDRDSGQPHTAHTIGKVPLVYVGGRASKLELADGSLRDIAPTLLSMMGLARPAEMSGTCLLKGKP